MAKNVFVSICTKNYRRIEEGKKGLQICDIIKKLKVVMIGKFSDYKFSRIKNFLSYVNEEWFFSMTTH